MRRQYANNPIQEALCEFIFEPGVAWDSTIPGRIYEVIKANYPTTRPAKGIQASIAAAEGAVQQQIMEVERAHLWSADEKTVVQIGANYLCVNRLRPYVSWEEFRPTILQALDAFKIVAEPRKVQRVTLRYIDRITLPVPNVSLDDWFSFYVVGPKLSDPDPTPIASFLIGVNVRFEDERDLLHVQLASAQPGSTQEASCVLDTSYVRIAPDALALEDVGAWLENAHDKVTSAFEGSITDRLRALFDQEVGP